MYNIKDILEIQGFNENDLVGFGTKDATKLRPHGWRLQKQTIGHAFRKVDRLLAEGILPAVRFGLRSVRIRKSDISAMLAGGVS